MCVDGRTGIPAVERIARTKTLEPGRPERVEFESKRHGTQCLIGKFEVAPERVISPTVHKTPPEEDFAPHIGRTQATVPEPVWIFVADNLTTHGFEWMPICRFCRGQVPFRGGTAGVVAELAMCGSIFQPTGEPTGLQPVARP